jgi:hypothetical protein
VTLGVNTAPNAECRMRVYKVAKMATVGGD